MRILNAAQMREAVRRGRIRCTVRVWMRPQVKVGGRYRMDDGHVVVDSMTRIAAADPAGGYITEALISAIAQGDDEAKARLKEIKRLLLAI